MGKQEWVVEVSIEHGQAPIMRKVFSDGTSSENYEAAQAEYDHLSGFKYFGFEAGPCIYCRESQE